MADQEDGAYPRINGAMLQSQQYNGMLVSVVGHVTGHNTLQAADGVTITLDTDSIAEALLVNPDMAVEIIGVAQDATTIQVRLTLFDLSKSLFAFLSIFLLLATVGLLSTLGLCFSQSRNRPGHGYLQQDDRDPVVSSICSLFPSAHGHQLSALSREAQLGVWETCRQGCAGGRREGHLRRVVVSLCPFSMITINVSVLDFIGNKVAYAMSIVLQ
jgi:hypothetical protein